MSLQPRPSTRRRTTALAVLVGLLTLAVLAGLRYRHAAFIRNAEAFHARYDDPEPPDRSSAD